MGLYQIDQFVVRYGKFRRSYQVLIFLKYCFPLTSYETMFTNCVWSFHLEVTPVFHLAHHMLVLLLCQATWNKSILRKSEFGLWLVHCVREGLAKAEEAGTFAPTVRNVFILTDLIGRVTHEGWIFLPWLIYVIPYIHVERFIKI